MKSIRKMSTGELAAYVCEHLKNRELDPVLTGGSAVTVYSQNKYVSRDLDFVERRGVRAVVLKETLAEIGFEPQGRHFVHPEADYLVEFPPGPLSVGDEPIRDVRDIEFTTGTLRIISPTDSVKDRLAAWYHWNDRQCLEQARLVADSHDVDLKEIERWSRHEGMIEEFQEIKESLTRDK